MTQIQPLYNRCSVKYAVSRVMNALDGIGESKRQARASSEIAGQNGQKVSEKVHSIKSMQNARTVATQYAEYVKANYGKIYPNLSSQTMRDFLQSKLDQVSGPTMNTYISTAAKIADAFRRLGVKNIDRNDILALRNELKNSDIDLSKHRTDRSYTAAELEKMREYMQDTPYLLSFDLQRQAGMRIDDATDSKKWSIDRSTNTITIRGSKNGLTYTTRDLPSRLIDRAAVAKQIGYKANKTIYGDKLREAGAYKGSHGLRYTFAQERVAQLQEKGYSLLEALSQTSLDMGHSREEITKHYTEF